MLTGIIDEPTTDDEDAAVNLLLALPAVYAFNYYYDDICYCCCYSEESIRSLCLLLFLVDSVFLAESIDYYFGPF
jgi:hypothetical protein